MTLTSSLGSLLRKVKAYGLARSFSYVFYDLVWYARRFIFGSYSQESEDLVIDRLLGSRSKGFYVDVGAGDPVKFSNTKRFSKRGWSGINIEPNPDTYLKLCADRPLDVNLTCGYLDSPTLLLRPP